MPTTRPPSEPGPDEPGPDTTAADADASRRPSPEGRLRELGLVLPGPHPPHDPLDAVVVHGGVARTSGQLPRDADGVVVTGVLGADLDIEAGAAAARWCALNALSVLRAELGSLDRIERLLTVTAFVASAPGFAGQPAVADGASRLLVEVLGDAGRHTRSAIGVAALPRGGAVEIEVHAALR
jgi:enamine deaminase RidA (YjgF/YER057c/UK114 family)